MSVKESYLVYGASGVQGGAVARLLLDEGALVRTITRDEKTALSLKEQGIETIVGELSDASLLDSLHAGVDKVFLSLPVHFEISQVRSYIRHTVEAAKRAKVQLLVVNTSVYVPETPTETTAIEIKRELINEVKQSGVPYIIVQPTLYMENFLLPGLLNNGALAYPVPADQPIAWISADDAAKFHYYALTHPELAGSTLQASGPEALTGTQIAEAFGTVLGQHVVFYPLPIDAFQGAIGSLLGEQTAAGLAGLYRWINEHTVELPGPIQIQADLKEELKLTSFADWLKLAAERGYLAAN
jgi:uncharacterized protein YbjT (DUF2867 family)